MKPLPLSYLSWRRRLSHRNRRATAALEFALMAPILSALLVGSVDAAQTYVAELNLASAIYAGINYALVNASQATSTNGATLASNIATVVGNLNGSGTTSGTVVVNNGPQVVFASGTNTASGTASNADSYYCLTGSPGSWTWGTAQSGPTLCGTGLPYAGKFITIQASVTVNPIITGLSFVNGTITQYVAIQVQ